MLVTVNGVDITPHINESSYNMSAEEVFTKWEDGNYVEHRVVVREKVSGKFRVALYGKEDMDTDAFLKLWNGAVKNSIVTILVFVQNKNKNEAIEAFYKIKPISHNVSDMGVAVDIFEISLEEC